jgi:thiol-disulfide isomerase/thioredoxin
MANKRRKNPSSTGRHQQQRQEARQNRTSSAQNERNRRRRGAPKRSPWLLLGGVVILIAAIVGFFLFLSNQSSSSTGSSKTTSSSNLVDATTLKEVTSVDPGTLSAIGTGGVANPFSTIQKSAPIMSGPTGKPEVFYYGAEWCPLCAAERWSIVVAMSRFGTFKTLKENTSASDDSYPSTSTFTFYPDTYSSSYIDFVPLENEDQQRNVLQTPTADQQQILTRYNVTGYPFMDIGDHYVLTAASYDPTVLRSNPSDQTSTPLTQQEIAAQLSSENQLSKDILGTANYLTAATCAITKNQPSTVCSDSSIQKIETSLSSGNSSGATVGGALQATLGGAPVADIWRRWSLF